jgi:ATP-dependent DNA helicase RecQ
MLVDFIRGANTPKITEAMKRLKTYGVGSNKPDFYWTKVIQQLIRQEILVQTENNYPVLKITQKAIAVLKGEEKVLLERVKIPPKSTFEKTSTLNYDKELFAKLKMLRLQLANNKGIPPYQILADTTLMELCTYFPQSLESIRQINGFGAYKIEKYGPVFVHTIASHCQLHRIDEVEHLKNRRGRI